MLVTRRQHKFEENGSGHFEDAILAFGNTQSVSSITRAILNEKVLHDRVSLPALQEIFCVLVLFKFVMVATGQIMLVFGLACRIGDCFELIFWDELLK